MVVGVRVARVSTAGAQLFSLLHFWARCCLTSATSGRQPGHISRECPQNAQGAEQTEEGRYVTAYKAQAEVYQAEVLGQGEPQPDGETDPQSEYAQLVEVLRAKLATSAQNFQVGYNY